MTTKGVHPRLIRRAAAALAGASIALGAAGAASLAFVGASHPTHAAAGPSVQSGGSGDPYFVCIAYAHQWGICIGPPTN